MELYTENLIPELTFDQIISGSAPSGSLSEMTASGTPIYTPGQRFINAEFENCVFKSSTSGARIEIFPDALTGMVIYGSNNQEVLKAMIGGVDAGDVSIGNYTSGQGILYDASANVLHVKGDLEVSSIHIPDQTTANSFHTDTAGNSWWGCNVADFQQDHNNAAAYILNNGVAKFNTVTYIGNSTDINKLVYYDGTDMWVNGSKLTSTTTFGDGSDGDVTISSNTTITRDMYYNNLTVNAGVTLSCGGYRIFVKNKLTNNGTISANGGNGGNGGSYSPYPNVQNGGRAGTAQASGSVYGGTDGVAGGHGGWAGNNGISITHGMGSNGASGGKSGGADGNATQYVGGAGGTVSGTIYNTPYSFIGAYLLHDLYPSLDMIRTSASGGSGAGGGLSGSGGVYDCPSSTTGGGTGGGGGGSGASAGFCWISAKNIINSGTIQAKGGNGGAGGMGNDSYTKAASGGGGAGGSGGVVLLIYSSLTNTGTISAPGGTGGTHGGYGYWTYSGQCIWNTKAETPPSENGQDGLAGKVIYIPF